MNENTTKGQGRKSWQTNEPILDVQYGRVIVERDLYPYDGVVEKVQRPEPFEYQMWAHMRAAAVHSSTVLQFGLPRLMAPTLGLHGLDASAILPHTTPAQSRLLSPLQSCLYRSLAGFC